MSFDAIIRSCMLVYHCQNLRRGSGATKACIAACMARPWHSRQVQARSPAAAAGPAAAGTARRRAAAAATPVGCTAACFEAQPPLPPASGRRPRGGQSSLHFAAWLVDEKQRGFSSPSRQYCSCSNCTAPQLRRDILQDRSMIALPARRAKRGSRQNGFSTPKKLVTGTAADRLLTGN